MPWLSPEVERGPFSNGCRSEIEESGLLLDQQGPKVIRVVSHFAQPGKRKATMKLKIVA